MQLLPSANSKLPRPHAVPVEVVVYKSRAVEARDARAVVQMRKNCHLGRYVAIAELVSVDVQAVGSTHGPEADVVVARVDLASDPVDKSVHELVREVLEGYVGFSVLLLFLPKRHVRPDRLLKLRSSG